MNYLSMINLKLFGEKMDSRELAAISAAMNRFASETRKSCLRQIIRVSFNVAREMGFHTSGYLTELAQFIEEESSVDPDTKQTRDVVSSLIETAAIEAEAEGRELP